MCLSILTWCGVFLGGGVVACTVKDMMDDKMNHCYYYGTVKTNTSMHLNSSAWGTPQIGLSLGPSHWCCGKTSNVSHRCVVSDPHPPCSTCKNTISSDVQYKPQTLPSKHPTMNLSQNERQLRGIIEPQKLYLPCKPLPHPKTATTTLSYPPSPQECVSLGE